MNVTRLQPAEIPQIWHCLQQISDPELPVLSITDLGMVRDVARERRGLARDLHSDVLRLPGHRISAQRHRAATGGRWLQPGAGGHSPQPGLDH